MNPKTGEIYEGGPGEPLRRTYDLELTRDQARYLATLPPAQRVKKLTRMKRKQQSKKRRK